MIKSKSIKILLHKRARGKGRRRIRVRARTAAGRHESTVKLYRVLDGLVSTHL
jgi:hypothetical protein